MYMGLHFMVNPHERDDKNDSERAADCRAINVEFSEDAIARMLQDVKNGDELFHDGIVQSCFTDIDSGAVPTEDLDKKRTGKRRNSDISYRASETDEDEKGDTYTKNKKKSKPSKAKRKNN